MSYPLVFPSQWDEFESIFDKLVTDRYGPASKGTKLSNDHNGIISNPTNRGTSLVREPIRPKIDLVETGEGLIMTVELPGAKKEEISIELHHGQLTISTEIKSPVEHQQANLRVSERSFGQYLRKISVPQTISFDQIKASFHDGLLEIKIPNLNPNKETHRIQIS
ncbi:HSP20-like chaperone [Melampsora americana]|nr:HSP20-like chaperone [Melampsora americana]